MFGQHYQERRQSPVSCGLPAGARCLCSALLIVVAQLISHTLSTVLSGDNSKNTTHFVKHLKKSLSTVITLWFYIFETSWTSAKGVVGQHERKTTIWRTKKGTINDGGRMSLQRKNGEQKWIIKSNFGRFPVLQLVNWMIFSIRPAETRIVSDGARFLAPLPLGSVGGCWRRMRS